MRHPPSPLLLSARKRRPRRNPPRGQFGGQFGAEPAGESAQQQQQQGSPEEKCARRERTPGDGPAQVHAEDDDSGASSR